MFYKQLCLLLENSETAIHLAKLYCQTQGNIFLTFEWISK